MARNTEFCDSMKPITTNQKSLGGIVKKKEIISKRNSMYYP